MCNMYFIHIALVKVIKITTSDPLGFEHPSLATDPLLRQVST